MSSEKMDLYEKNHGDLVYCAIKPWKLNLPPPN